MRQVLSLPAIIFALQSSIILQNNNIKQSPNIKKNGRLINY